MTLSADDLFYFDPDAWSYGPIPGPLMPVWQPDFGTDQRTEYAVPE